MTEILTTAATEGHDEALDAYSSIVVRVAGLVVPVVTALHVARGPQEGAGSAVVLSPDGYLLTSAHVVAGTPRGTPRSPTATRPPSR